MKPQEKEAEIIPMLTIIVTTIAFVKHLLSLRHQNAINLKCIFLGEINQSGKAIYCTTHSGKGKTVEKVERSVVARGYGRGNKKGGLRRGMKLKGFLGQ